MARAEQYHAPDDSRRRLEEHVGVRGDRPGVDVPGVRDDQPLRNARRERRFAGLLEQREHVAPELGPVAGIERTGHRGRTDWAHALNLLRFAYRWSGAVHSRADWAANQLARRQPDGAPRRLAARNLHDALDRIPARLAGEARRRTAREVRDREAHVIAAHDELLERRGRPAERRGSADPERLLDEREPRALPP